MSAKSVKIWYWIITILFSLFMLYSGIGGFMPNEQTVGVMQLLQYPLYLLVILGVAKMLGVIAILQTKWNTIKEWAYAGFTFDILGAAVSFGAVGAGAGSVIFTAIFLIPLFLSYWLWKKSRRLQSR